MKLREKFIAKLKTTTKQDTLTSITQQEEKKQKVLEKLRSQYEEASKIATNDPVKQAAVEFYGRNFDSNERVIGINFINEKILLNIVPLVKETISSEVLKGNIDINQLHEKIKNMVSEGHNISELQNESSISEIFYYNISSDEKTLEERVQEILFDNKPPFPYKDDKEYNEDDKSSKTKHRKNEFNEEQMETLTRDLITRLIIGEVEYINTICPTIGTQLAILEALTDKFDERATLKKGFPISYDIEKQLLNSSDKKKTITCKSTSGKVYKEEMMLYILQKRFEVMQRSGKYDENDIRTIHIKDKITKLYQKHRLRIFDAEEAYMKELLSKIYNESNPDSKYFSFRLQQLKNEYKKSKQRTEKRWEIWNKQIKHEIYKDSDVIPKKRYITVPGLVNIKDSLTHIEAQAVLKAYQSNKHKINSSNIPLNKLYACSVPGWRKGERTSYSRMLETPIIENAFPIDEEYSND